MADYAGFACAIGRAAFLRTSHALKVLTKQAPHAILIQQKGLNPFFLAEIYSACTAP